MSIISSELLLGAAGAAGGYEIERGLRFNKDDSAYLDRTPSSAGNRKTWTWSGWVKRCGNNNFENIFSAGGSDTSARTNITIFFYQDDDAGNPGRLVIGDGNGAYLRTTATFRDPSAWGHLVIVTDTTLSTAGDRIKIYWNGVRITDFNEDTLATNVPQNSDLGLNTTERHTIGNRSYNSTLANYSNLYLADIHFIDGQALDPTDFGVFDDNGVWQPIAYAGSYGTNGYHLDFSDSSTVAALGTDTSGNGNDWTVNNISNGTTTSFNLDVTSTPFIDIGRNISITNLGTVGTISAGTNSFNLTTVASFGGSGSGEYLRTGNITIGSQYTFDYYFNANTSQVGNATVIDGGSEAIIRDYGSATSRNIRIGGTDYSYSVSANTWNHVRVSNTGIWVNGTLITGSPNSAADKTNVFYIGTYNNSTSYLFNGEIGPVRIADEDLGAPPSGGLVANTDGTLSNVTGFSNDTDVFFDSPTNGTQTDTGAGGEVVGNYATLNPLSTAFGGAQLINGNLEWDYVSSGNYNNILATMDVSNGKYYWEWTYESGKFGGIAGITSAPAAANQRLGREVDFGLQSATVREDGIVYGNFTGGGLAQQKTFAFAYDGPNRRVRFFIDGTEQTINSNSYYDLTSISASDQAFPAFNTNNNDVHFILNFGQRAFAYAAPSGYKALCTANLDDPTIADGSTAMDVSLWDGTSSTQSITGLGFSPDLVWGKRRSGTQDHVWIDVIRGTNVYLRSNSTSANTTDANIITSLNSDGFTLGTSGIINDSGSTNVGWTWDAGTSTGTNTDGTITSTVRANPSAGFSIVTWTGTGAAGTLGHGLGAKPDLLFLKVYSGDVGGWATYSSDLGATKLLQLNSTSAALNNGAYWNSTEPTSSVFSVGNAADGNGLGKSFITYCFTSVEGFSSIGSYTGNGSTNGPFVYTGFRPRFVLIKRTDSTSQWHILDSERAPYNVMSAGLNANTAGPEGVGTAVDFLSNGFKLRQLGEYNTSSGDYIYATFAENPFKISRAR